MKILGNTRWYCVHTIFSDKIFDFRIGWQGVVHQSSNKKRVLRINALPVSHLLSFQVFVFERTQTNSILQIIYKLKYYKSSLLKSLLQRVGTYSMLRSSAGQWYLVLVSSSFFPSLLWCRRRCLFTNLAKNVCRYGHTRWPLLYSDQLVTTCKNNNCLREHFKYLQTISDNRPRLDRYFLH